MFLHLGANVVIPKKDVIMLIDLKTASKAEGTKEFIQLMKKEGYVVVGEGEEKSMVLCTHMNYFSPISSNTLKKRADSLQEMIKNW